MSTFVEQALIEGQIVADGVVGGPAAEERKARPELELDRLGCLAASRRSQIGRRDVAYLVSVVDMRGRGGQQRLERLESRQAALAPHVLEAREGALELGARMHHVDRLFHGYVAPVRHFDGALEALDSHERGVVLGVHTQLVLSFDPFGIRSRLAGRFGLRTNLLQWLDAVVRPIRDGRVALACRLEL